MKLLLCGLSLVCLASCQSAPEPSGIVALLESSQVAAYSGKISGRTGVRMMQVNPELAAKLGVRDGDVLMAVTGQPVGSSEDALVAIRRAEPGPVTTTWLSAGRELERVFAVGR